MFKKCIYKWTCLGLIVIISSCSSSEDELYSADISMDRDINDSGKLLQKRSNGLHPIISEEAKKDTIFIAVHGYESKGYEWVYALNKMISTGNQTYYYRWNWNNCPEASEKKLYDSIMSLLSEQRDITHINILGHSYGGTVVVGLADENFPATVEIHAIAAPLISYSRLAIRCPSFEGYDGSIAYNKLFLWRTVKEQDGAFKEMQIDPQIIKIENSNVIELPSYFDDGRRLGHNWSIAWVVDSYLGN